MRTFHLQCYGTYIKWSKLCVILSFCDWQIDEQSVCACVCVHVCVWDVYAKFVCTFACVCIKGELPPEESWGFLSVYSVKNRPLTRWLWAETDELRVTICIIQPKPPPRHPTYTHTHSPTSVTQKLRQHLNKLFLGLNPKIIICSIFGILLYLVFISILHFHYSSYYI